ncbi:hypothetical protein O7623_00020 [Solwaraspora sp. WMMD791]|uniref:hypothetical protein n=1 Tax=Solwaraspora sp. WMMD791 TaxID=3016086 RepID=UPI00249A241A|nr:hypothetical protein [Solwaraspora sp. WMMD791]WFE27635.1 hypothetical protein O7623_31255 [Solwaraspora sp. WMMD791]WFE27648.1 hypothetical protein O7623_00020 [Solwaraspora sp. WMMD791]
MYRSMEYGDTARVIAPTDATEYRLGIVIDVRYSTPHTTHARSYTLRFPNGTERTYPAAQVAWCTRADDYAALETAFVTACVALRDACRIAHDYDADLANGTASLLRRLVDLARLRLALTLDPANPTRPGNNKTGGGH